LNTEIFGFYAVAKMHTDADDETNKFKLPMGAHLIATDKECLSWDAPLGTVYSLAICIDLCAKMARCEMFRYRQATGECLVEFPSIEHDKDHTATGEAVCSEGWGEALSFKTYRLDDQTRIFHRWKVHHWKLHQADGTTPVLDSSAAVQYGHEYHISAGYDEDYGLPG
jgi:hypothetical protein